MPSLNIRNISDTLMKRLKSESALAGVTLREYVIGKLGENGRPCNNHRAVVPESGGEVRRDEGRQPDAAGGVEKRPVRAGKHCPHGKEKGYHCGMCGGLAKVE
jgi:hypothetical protein